MSLLNKKDENNPINNWYHPNLINSLNKLIKEVGRQPDYIVNKPNGVVCFNNPENWIVEHVLRDEYIHHCVPKRHIDYLYTTVRIFVPPKKVPDVQSISGSVILDLLKNTVSTRCASTSANYATLRTVVDVIKGNFTREEISVMYKTNLSNSWNEFDSNKDKVRKYVTKNPVKDIQYHPFAFPEGCDKVLKNTEEFTETPKMKEVKYRPSNYNSKLKEVYYKK
jgi:hypothetical protein